MLQTIHCWFLINSGQDAHLRPISQDSSSLQKQGFLFTIVFRTFRVACLQLIQPKHRFFCVLDEKKKRNQLELLHSFHVGFLFDKDKCCGEQRGTYPFFSLLIPLCGLVSETSTLIVKREENRPSEKMNSPSLRPSLPSFFLQINRSRLYIYTHTIICGGYRGSTRKTHHASTAANTLDGPIEIKGTVGQ